VVNMPPIPQFACPPPGYANASYRFDATTARDPDGSIVNYTWDFGDGSKGYGIAIDHNYTMPGNYTVRLTVMDNDGASCSTSSLLVVREIPRPPPPPPPPENKISNLVYIGLGVAIGAVLLGIILFARPKKHDPAGAQDAVAPLDDDSMMQGPGTFQG